METTPPSPLKAVLQSILLHVFILLTGALVAHGWLDTKTSATFLAWFGQNIGAISEYVGAAIIAYGTFAWSKAKHLLANEYVKAVKEDGVDPKELHPEVAKALGVTAPDVTKASIVVGLAIGLMLPGCSAAEIKTATTDGAQVSATVSGLFTAANALWDAGSSIATSQAFIDLLKSYGVSDSDISNISTIAAQGKAAGAIAVPSTNTLATYLYNLAKAQS